ncbi:membrane-associated proteins in eicosanoid and glutathione metabolism [Imleria badia]|nr:membrane-associated proteins in eicosanoid and glutathione metabolism [Imleria badia]
MSPQIILPNGFGYVPASLLSLGWVLAWQTFLVGGARKRAGITYPQLYAEQVQVKASPAAMQFNCTQRAHQNTLEVTPIVTLSTLVFGLKCPHAAAMMCGSFVLGRIIYTLGYKTGNPANRVPGAFIANLSTLGERNRHSQHAVPLISL